MVMNKKAQAAMEFAHTYGWVLITVVVLGGLLLYYGISQPDHLLSRECAFVSGLNCIDATVEDTYVSVMVINEFGFPISNITAEMKGTCNSTANTTDGNPFSNPNTMLQNSQDRIVFECQDLTGKAIEERINVTYVNAESGQRHWKIGKMVYRPGE
ncbi:TPA: hypothetical protein HA265_06245 [Candidatus Woesearchaeota archaeon]|nr:hypothetical protein [Candidatus Woesearchaeota archaeon]